MRQKRTDLCQAGRTQAAILLLSTALLSSAQLGEHLYMHHQTTECLQTWWCHHF